MPDVRFLSELPLLVALHFSRLLLSQNVTQISLRDSDGPPRRRLVLPVVFTIFQINLLMRTVRHIKRVMFHQSPACTPTPSDCPNCRGLHSTAQRSGLISTKGQDTGHPSDSHNLHTFSFRDLTLEVLTPLSSSPTILWREDVLRTKLLAKYTRSLGFKERLAGLDDGIYEFSAAALSKGTLIPGKAIS